MAMEQMKRYRWPGNVREMKNVIERAIVLAEGVYIDQQDLMLSKLPTTGDTNDMPPSRQNLCRAAWRMSNAAISWPRSRPPAGTKAKRQACWESNAQPWTARSSVTS